MLGQEIEQRQAALDRAAEHLSRATDARREAADAAQRLQELTRGITYISSRNGRLTSVYGGTTPA